MVDVDWAPRSRASSAGPRRASERAPVEQDVFCICRKPYNGEWMIVCEKCDEWFHGGCIKLDEEQGGLALKYYCPQCSHKHGLASLWKPKCRLGSCWEPALVSEGSKYCSRRHGIEFFRELAGRVHGLDAAQVAALVAQTPELESLHTLGAGGAPERELAAAAAATTPNPDQAEIETAQTEIVQLERRKKYIELAVQRKDSLSRAEFGEGKKRKVCAFDPLLLDDPAFVLAHADDAELPDGENVCHIEQQKCLKHAYWASLMTDQASLQIAQLERRIAQLQQAYLETLEGHERSRLATESLLAISAD